MNPVYVCVCVTLQYNTLDDNLMSSSSSTNQMSASQQQFWIKATINHQSINQSINQSN
jgi:hypothetical protein